MSPQFHNGRAPAAAARTSQSKRCHLGALAKNRMDRFPKRAGSLAMNDADLENSFLTARLEIVDNQMLDITRVKGVEIQRAVDGNLDRIEIFEFVIHDGMHSFLGHPRIHRRFYHRQCKSLCIACRVSAARFFSGRPARYLLSRSSSSAASNAAK